MEEGLGVGRFAELRVVPDKFLDLHIKASRPVVATVAVAMTLTRATFDGPVTIS